MHALTGWHTAVWIPAVPPSDQKRRMWKWAGVEACCLWLLVSLGGAPLRMSADPLPPAGEQKPHGLTWKECFLRVRFCCSRPGEREMCLCPLCCFFFFFPGRDTMRCCWFVVRCDIITDDILRRSTRCFISVKQQRKKGIAKHPRCQHQHYILFNKSEQGVMTEQCIKSNCGVNHTWMVQCCEQKTLEFVGFLSNILTKNESVWREWFQYSKDESQLHTHVPSFISKCVCV